MSKKELKQEILLYNFMFLLQIIGMMIAVLFVINGLWMKLLVSALFIFSLLFPLDRIIRIIIDIRMDKKNEQDN